MELIKKLRKEIDRNDEVIITALAQRMSMMPEFADFKIKNNVPIFEEKREQEIMTKLKQQAQDSGLSDDFVEEIFLSIFNEAKRIQHEVMNKTDDLA